MCALTGYEYPGRECVLTGTRIKGTESGKMAVTHFEPIHSDKD